VLRVRQVLQVLLVLQKALAAHLDLEALDHQEVLALLPLQEVQQHQQELPDFIKFQSNHLDRID